MKLLTYLAQRGKRGRVAPGPNSPARNRFSGPFGRSLGVDSVAALLVTLFVSYATQVVAGPPEDEGRLPSEGFLKFRAGSEYYDSKELACPKVASSGLTFKSATEDAEGRVRCFFERKDKSVTDFGGVLHVLQCPGGSAPMRKGESNLLKDQYCLCRTDLVAMGGACVSGADKEAGAEKANKKPHPADSCFSAETKAPSTSRPDELRCPLSARAWDLEQALTYTSRIGDRRLKPTRDPLWSRVTIALGTGNVDGQPVTIITMNHAASEHSLKLPELIAQGPIYYRPPGEKEKQFTFQGELAPIPAAGLPKEYHAEDAAVAYFESKGTKTGIVIGANRKACPTCDDKYRDREGLKLERYDPSRKK